MSDNNGNKNSVLASTIVFGSDGGKSLNITPQDYLAHIEAQEMSPAERALALANFSRPECMDVIEAGKRKNLCVVITRSLDVATQRFLALLLQCINDLPDDIIWKARSPLVIDVGRIASQHIQGQANIRDSQACIKVGVTQILTGGDFAILRAAIAFDDDSVEMRRAANDTFVHEIFHKLATQHDQSGNLIMSRDDWVAMMHVNGVHTITILTPHQYELMQSGENPTLILDAIPVDELPQDPTEFIQALKRMFRHPIFYSSDVHELVAFSATNVDLSKGTDILHNPLHDLETTRSIMRRGLFRAKNGKGEFENYGYEFDGTRWKKYSLERAENGRFQTIHLEVATPKMLAFETYLRESFHQKDLLHEHDFVERVTREAETLAERELPFAWARLSAADQNLIQTISQKDCIDIRQLTVSWIVQEMLFDVITEEFGLQKCDRVGIHDPHGFIAMTGLSSLIISTGPNTRLERTMSYHPLRVRSNVHAARETHDRLFEDVTIGNRVRIAGLRTSPVRRLVRFSPQDLGAANQATAVFEQFNAMLKDHRRDVMPQS